MSEVDTPWYRRALRWGQTNLTEIDPGRYDSAFWRQRWKDTKLDGVIVNAGGIVAYYPSQFEQHRATGLADRDFYGDIVRDAREDGLVVIARMDSNRADEALFRSHPNWFTRDIDGEPYMAGQNYISCINGGYYTEFLPAVFKEIIERSHPDGFADNSWAGLESSKICYCENCVSAFREAAGSNLPLKHDWDDPVYRDWVRWNDRRRTEVWIENSRATSATGGADCVWVGMVSGDQAGEVNRFENLHAIAEEARIFFVDHQRRTPSDGFLNNADTGKRLHQLLGWDARMPESMAMYSAGSGFFRATSMPEPEVRVWAASGFAGGIQPWWHHISAVHEDLRQYDTPVPIFAFHQRVEKYLVDRTPVAQVAVVWSEQNNYFHGRDDPQDTAVNPYRGVINSLSRARILYLPVHLDDLGSLDASIRTIVLPDVAVMTETQAQTIRRLISQGISVLATGETSLKDEDGQRREDFLLADVLGIHALGSWAGSYGALGHDIEVWDRHNYLRFDRTPEGLGRAGLDSDDVDQIFAGLEKTSIISFGGRLQRITADKGAVLMTYVEPFPFYPPEFAWLPSTPTGVPGLVARTTNGGARIAYLAGDLDRSAGREARPDHLRLIADLVRWQIGEDPVLSVSGAGHVDCNLYEQDGRLVLHLVNVSSASSIPGTLDELVPVGPFEIVLKHSVLGSSTTAWALVSEVDISVDAGDGVASFILPRIEDHEIVVFGENSERR